MIKSRGRKKILSEANDYMLRQPFTDLNGEVYEYNIGCLCNEIDNALKIHSVNKADIKYLLDYKNGRQDIFDKTKDVRPEICNTLVVNHAQMITRMIVGYFLGTPIQYVQSGFNKREEIEYLNKAVSYEDKHVVDEQIAEYQSICGVGYRIIYSDGELADEVPFEDKVLSPLDTFVVYENTVAEAPLFGVYYYNKLDETGTVCGKKVYCYTNFGLFEFDSNSYDGGGLIPSDLVAFSPYSVGGVPIIEYPNNIWRLGDWELCIGLMEAINALQSGRLDDIEQTVQSLLVFINADIDEERYSEMRESGVVSLKNTTNYQSSVDVINNTLEQSGMESFSTQLEELLYALIGIPDRNSRSGGGGDTGTAVELRDGWADLEIVARCKEVAFKKSEKRCLKIILTMINNKQNMDLSPMDIIIKFNRNKNNNLLSKSQAYTTLLATKTLTPEDCLALVDLVSDANDYMTRGEAFWGEEFGGKTAKEEEVMENIIEEDEVVENIEEIE